jgi:capsular polysaccharide biosynthesis protein
MLAAQGFQTIDPARLSFTEQTALFAEAVVIVGAHGAALTNALFAPAGSALVELWSGRKQPHYADIAVLKGLRYAAVEGTGMPDTHQRPQHRDFRVDIDALRRALAAL